MSIEPAGSKHTIPRVKIVFFGTPDFAAASLRALIDSPHRVELVVAQPDRPAGRGMKMHVPPVIELARDNGLTFRQPEKVREPGFLDFVESLRPDIGVVVAYGKILPARLLAIPAHGFVNVHGSLLPEYRGAAPIQRAIEAGETVTGVSIMKVDEELDHGPVFAMEQTSIGADDHSPRLAERLARSGASLLRRVIDEISSGAAVAREQDHDRATHAPKITREEARVKWSDPAPTIYNRWRAFDPWPGIFTSIADADVKLGDLSVDLDHVDRRPGTILGISHAGLDVSTGKGLLRIGTLQRPGRKPVPSSIAAHDLGLRAGDILR